MGECLFANNIAIRDYGSPYVIAEVNSSHSGSVDVAKQMIDAAVDAGCDCVKFQSWSAVTLYSKSYYKENPIAKRFVDKFSLSSVQLKELSDYCILKGIGFSSTPYSREEVDFLVDECRVPFVKIASMELNNYDFLEYIGKKTIPVVLSTGMGEMQEIKNAIKILESTGNRNIVILHCVSIYPVEANCINLNNIMGLREEFPNYPIGFSDHTLGNEAAIAATALGAAVLEKHLTLDSHKIGMDNQMAMEPEALKNMIDKCRKVNQALGVKDRIVSADEYEQRKNMRRSAVAVRNLSAGTLLSKEDLDVKRPGTGVPPDKMNLLIGHRLKRDIEADTLVLADDVERES